MWGGVGKSMGQEYVEGVGKGTAHILTSKQVGERLICKA